MMKSVYWDHVELPCLRFVTEIFDKQINDEVVKYLYKNRLLVEIVGT